MNISINGYQWFYQWFYPRIVLTQDSRHGRHYGLHPTLSLSQKRLLVASARDFALALGAAQPQLTRQMADDMRALAILLRNGEQHPYDPYNPYGCYIWYSVTLYNPSYDILIYNPSIYIYIIHIWGVSHGGSPWHSFQYSSSFMTTGWVHRTISPLSEMVCDIFQLGSCVWKCFIPLKLALNESKLSWVLPWDVFWVPHVQTTTFFWCQLHNH